MKIAINGSSGKIGSAIFNYLQMRGEYEVVEIKTRLPRISFVVEEIGDADVFVNNVMHEWSQVDLLISLYEKWHNDPSKHIINIGSRASAPNVSVGYKYSTVKSALNHFSELVKFKDGEKLCKITTINPGLIGSSEIAMSPIEVAKTIEWVLSMPSHIEVSRIDIHNYTPYPLVQKMKAISSGSK